jgi:hypothetical protein
VTPGALSASGLDTVSVAYRPTSEGFFDALLRQPHAPTVGGGVLFREKGPGETRMGAHPRNGVVWWEGRVDALLSRRRDAWGLRPQLDLAAAESAARMALSDLAHRWLDGDGETRRFDLTAELSFEHGSDGLAFLRTVAGMCTPRRKTDVWRGQDGQPQTVYIRQARSGVVTERVYDKGVESGSHAPGQRIRLEAQRRPARGDRLRPGHLAKKDLTAEFGRSFLPYLGAENVTAAGADAATAHLAGMAARDEISMTRAENMIGSVALLRAFGRSVYPDVQQQQRRLRALREAGIALDEQLPPSATVPVGQLLRDAVESFSA